MQKSNKLYILLSETKFDDACDYFVQTAAELGRRHTVIALSVNEHYTLKNIINISNFQSRKQIKKPGVIFLRPIFIFPGQRLIIIKNINIFLFTIILKVIFAIRYKHHEKFVWVFDPRMYFMSKFFGKGYKLIFDCLDYYRESTFSKEENREIQINEDQLLKKANYVFVNSSVLFQIHRHVRKDIHLAPQGFRIEEFQQIRKTSIKLLKNKKVVGYVGGINYRLDFKLLYEVISVSPDFSFVFFGSETNDNDYFVRECLPLWRSILKLPNVKWYGFQPSEIVPWIISQIDVCIIPYNIDFKLNLYSYPMKFIEYVYCGKLIISTPILELMKYPDYVRIATTPAQWIEQLRRINQRKISRSKHLKMQELSRSNSWKNKIALIEKIVMNNEYA